MKSLKSILVAAPYLVFLILGIASISIGQPGTVGTTDVRIRDHQTGRGVRVTHANALATDATQSGTWNVNTISHISTVVHVVATAQVSDTHSTGSIATPGTTTVEMDVPSGFSTLAAQLSGTWVGTVVLDGTNDAITWRVLNTIRLSDGYVVRSVTSNDTLVTNIAGMAKVRIRFSSYTSGTLSVSYRMSSAPGPVVNFVAQDLQLLKSNTIDSNSGNASAATQRVVIATDQPALNNLNTTVNQLNGAWNVSSAHQGGQWNINHVSSITHIGGQVQIVNRAGTVISKTPSESGPYMAMDLTQVLGSNIATNSGNVGTDVIRFVIASNQPALSNIPAGSTGSDSGSTALNGSGVTIAQDINSTSGATFQIAAGTLAATLSVDVSTDAGATYINGAGHFIDIDDGTISATYTTVNPNVAKRFALGWLGSVTSVRVRVSSYTSGTANGVIYRVSNFRNPVELHRTANSIFSVTHISSVTHVGLIGNLACHSKAGFSNSGDFKLFHANTAFPRINICSIVIVVSAAANVSVVEGTGATCGTNPVSILGSTTAAGANGMAFAANGGFTSISGTPWTGTSVAENDVCILSSAGRISGTITYRGF